LEATPPDARGESVLLWSARAATLDGNFNRAVDDIGRLRKLFPASARLAEGVFIQGAALIETGRFQEALMVFDDLITHHPESAWTTRAWLRKGDALYQLGVEQESNFAASIAAYEEALLRHDATPATRFEACFKIGRGLEKNNRVADAFDYYYANVVSPFFELLQTDPANAAHSGEWFSRAVFRAVEMLSAKNDPDAAIRLLDRVIQNNAPGAVEAAERIKRLRKQF